MSNRIYFIPDNPLGTHFYIDQAGNLRASQGRWICDNPEVRSVVFVGAMSQQIDSAITTRLVLTFKDGAIKDFEKKEPPSALANENKFDDLIQQAEEYLDNGGRGERHPYWP